MKSRRFLLYREQDVSGSSGVGIVAEGCVLPSGRVAMEWLVPPSNFGLYSSLQALIDTHGHQGRTLVLLKDGEE